MSTPVPRPHAPPDRVPTNPFMLADRLRTRFAATAREILDEVEGHMTGLTHLESDGSFSYIPPHPERLNPTVLTILQEWYGGGSSPADANWWRVEWDGEQLEFIPARLPDFPSGRLDR